MSFFDKCLLIDSLLIWMSIHLLYFKFVKEKIGMIRFFVPKKYRIFLSGFKGINVFSRVDISDIFITGDTLALHVATALKKSVVCMFGPTSYTEIEDFGRITKVIPDLDCLVCYKNTCDIRPNCMEIISVEMVYNKVVENLQKLRKI